MSGIVGIYYLDDRPVEAAEIERMLDAMPHRKVDGQGQWIHGSVGLGHGLLHTTPESFYEDLPLTLEHVTITADARLDNRDVLFKKLGIEPERQALTPDSELIAHAYLRLGIDCAKYLLGDFAFALWDDREKRLFCVRNHFGTKPFYYHRLGDKFIFASEIPAIISLLGTAPRVREQTIISEILQDYRDKTHTYLENIYRLPPGHYLISDASGNYTIQEYWKLDPERELQIRSFEEYVEQFHELFTEAVRCRLRSAFPVGSALSGGLDSSAIACVARDLLRESDPNFDGLPVFSIYTPDVPQTNERRYQDVVINTGGFKPHFLRADQTGPFVDAQRRMAYTDEPIYRGNEYSQWIIHSAANEAGLRVILNGYDGDSTVSHGDAILREWTVKRNWTAISRHIQYAAQILQGEEIWAGSLMMKNHVLPTLKQLAQQGEGLAALQGLVQLRRFIARSPLGMAKVSFRTLFPEITARLRSYRTNTRPVERYVDIFSEDVIRRFHLDGQELPLDLTVNVVDARQYHYNLLIPSYLPNAFEFLEQSSAVYQLDTRFPFCDVPFVEFNLAAPAEYKMYQGWPRSGFRAAMNGIVPEAVRTRLTKGVYSYAFLHVIKTYNTFEIELVRQNIERLMPVINVEHFNDMLDKYLQGDLSNEAQLWLVCSICIWLYYAG